MKKYEKKTDEFEPDVTQFEEKAVEEVIETEIPITILVNNLNVRENPGRQYPVLRTAIQGKTKISETYTDDSTGITWGKLVNGGWIDMQYAKVMK